MQTCFNIAGTLLKNITFSAALKLYGGGSFLNFWEVDLRGQGYPYHIPAGPISFNVCGNITLYTPESPTSWKLQFMDSEQNGPTNFQWVNILALRRLTSFKYQTAPNMADSGVNRFSPLFQFTSSLLSDTLPYVDASLYTLSTGLWHSCHVTFL